MRELRTWQILYSCQSNTAQHVRPVCSRQVVIVRSSRLYTMSRQHLQFCFWSQYVHKLPPS